MEPHDDADRYGFAGDALATFDYDPAPDFDGMDYDDERSLPRCGGPVFEGRVQVGGCDGCRHCFPPDAESIHTGFETYDRPDFYRLRNELAMLAAMGYALPPTPWDSAAGRAYFLRAIGFSARMLRAAKHKLSMICDRCETHPEAVAEYAAWAEFVKSKINY